jgi:hypothetical protein
MSFPRNWSYSWRRPKRRTHGWLWITYRFGNPRRYQICPICNLLRRCELHRPISPKKGLTLKPKWEYKLDSNWTPLLRVPPCPSGDKREETP